MTTTLCGRWKKLARCCENRRKTVHCSGSQKKVLRCYVNWRKTVHSGQEDVRFCQRRKPKIDC